MSLKLVLNMDVYRLVQRLLRFKRLINNCKTRNYFCTSLYYIVLIVDRGTIETAFKTF